MKKRQAITPIPLYERSTAQWTKAGVRFARAAQEATERLAAMAARCRYDLVDAELIMTHAVSLPFTIRKLEAVARRSGSQLTVGKSHYRVTVVREKKS